MVACFTCLADRYPGLEVHRDRVAVAVNEEYAAWDRGLADGDVVAFVPPVSGGSEPDVVTVDVHVGEAPVSAAALRELVASPAAGAIATFEGTVRDHTGDRPTSHLEYEAYAPMAERLLRDIAAAAAEHWDIVGIAIHHRVGRLEIGEVSVAVAVSAGHRAEAFAACRFAIDTLKSEAPIWKKEYQPDGSHWVEGPIPGRGRPSSG